MTAFTSPNSSSGEAASRASTSPAEAAAHSWALIAFCFSLSCCCCCCCDVWPTAGAAASAWLPAAGLLAGCAAPRAGVGAQRTGRAHHARPQPAAAGRAVQSRGLCTQQLARQEREPRGQVDFLSCTEVAHSQPFLVAAPTCGPGPSLARCGCRLRPAILPPGWPRKLGRRRSAKPRAVGVPESWRPSPKNWLHYCGPFDGPSCMHGHRKPASLSRSHSSAGRR